MYALNVLNTQAGEFFSFLMTHGVSSVVASIMVSNENSFFASVNVFVFCVFWGVSVVLWFVCGDN